MNPLNAYLAFEIMSDRIERAERHRAARAARPRPEMRRDDALTIRRATPDGMRARHLGARPRLIAHPLRRAAWSLHRGQRRAERYS